MVTESRPPEYQFTWSVEPRSEPLRVVKYCPHCRCPRRFRCAYKFRVNANRKLIDVWLLFDCCHCGGTAKMAVIERSPVSRIEPSLLQAFEANDPHQALALACDPALLKRAGFSVEPHRPVIDGPRITAEDMSARSGQSRVLLIFRGSEMALKKVLAAQMAISRRDAQRLVDSGAIRCGPPTTLASGQRAVDIVIEWDAVRRILGGD